MARGKTISFGRFAVLCQELEGTSSASMMRNKLAKFFEDIPPFSIKISSYFLLGMIGPKYGNIDLGIGDKVAINIIACAFDRNENVVKEQFQRLGDLGDVAQSFSKKKRSSLKLEDVYETFNRFKNVSGEGSQKRRADLLAGLLQEASALEAKYIMRISLGSMRLGVGEMTILDAFALAFSDGLENRNLIEDGYNKNTDIGAIGKSMSEHGLIGVRLFSISLGRPVKMMLAKRANEISEIIEKFQGKEFAAEEKYDGERVQVHKNGDKVLLFSRRLEDITAQYPDVAEFALEAVDADKAVLDGEIVSWKNEKMMSFQKLMQRRRKHKVEEYRKKIPVVLALFDIIYLEGNSLLKLPYPDRRKILEDTVAETKNAFLVNRVVSSDFNKIENFFRQCVEKGFEGIIVKATSEESIYQPGKRGWLWIKWKKEYAAGMRETFDVVVVGSFHGSGKRQEFFGSLLCAVYNKEEDIFETFTKVGTGFTDEDFETIKEMIDKYKIPEKPKRLRLKNVMNPDQFYDPSVVIEIMGANITKSPSHTAGEEDGRGLALRFPRFLNIRVDKGPDDVTTVEEIESMRRR